MVGRGLPGRWQSLGKGGEGGLGEVFLRTIWWSVVAWSMKFGVRCVGR